MYVQYYIKEQCFQLYGLCTEIICALQWKQINFFYTKYLER